ncbi:nucleoside hydrolase [Neobittarella massiliensis]|uniref:Nucleoside hydrolase n=1 Tax=Neobittarella massiliensis (ex Bilen et al. 2018) TaxID=2041842 RepID=A0A8J6IPM3_9FIRM|nr:nucleoside hydrolase [Neobittarella massiliensis]MBC3516717.1 nucleoside hydrolase [Neobittarella massiliensis]
MELKKRPVIIDCDPGEDDAVCLFMMFADEQFDILGITPVCGNKPLDFCTTNALRLCELTGYTDIPVLKGAPKAIFREARTAGDIHGATGLGNVVLPDPVKTVEDEYAWDFIYRQAVAHKGELEILAVGPLTNLATALLKYPDLKDYVKQIVIMGGASGMGNMTPTAEFNIWADPEGAKVVFKSGIPMVMMGLEICYDAYVSPEDLKRIRGDKGGRVAGVAADLISKRVDHATANGMPGGVLCDAVSAAYMIDPSVIECEHVHVDVEVSGMLTEGKTVVTRSFTENAKREPNTYLGCGIDQPRFIDLIVAAVEKIDAQLAQ